MSTGQRQHPSSRRAATGPADRPAEEDRASPDAPDPRDSGELRVLYVTDRADAPYRYRCLHPCLQLRAEGVPCDILHVRDRRLLASVPTYSVIVLFRLPWSPLVSALVEAARDCGAALVLDMDDLVFDPALCSSLPFLADASKLIRLRYENSAARLRRTLDACDALIGATPAIARGAAQRGKRAFVYPNLLHPDLVRASGRIRAWRLRRQRELIIAYMSGSMTHDADFLLVADVLADLMAAHRDTSLLIGGFLGPRALGPLRGVADDRIIRLPFQDWRVQPWSLALARVNLAPLSVVNAFTNGKSALKFFEAAVIGVPTVATPTEPFQAAMSHGVNGYLASDAKTWYESILACLDPETSRCVGDAARRSALQDHAHAGHRHRLREILQSLTFSRDPKGSASSKGRAARPGGKPLPVPLDNPDLEVAARLPGRILSRAARARAVLGIIRRARRPASLSHPDLCRRATAVFEQVVVDPPMVGLEAALRATPPGEPMIRHRDRLLGMQVFGRPQPLGPWGVAAGVRSRLAATQRGARGGGTGEWMTSVQDPPALISPAVRIEPSVFVSLLVSQAVDAHLDEPLGGFFWRRAPRRRFTEKACVRFPVISDGLMHHYVVRLDNKEWVGDGTTIRGLCLGPMNVPGDFCLSRVVLLTPEFDTLSMGGTGILPVRGAS